MTRAPLTIEERERPDDFMSDVQIAERWGVCDKTARRAIKAFERAGGFPRKDPLFGNKRYWPAVDAFMRRRAGLSIAAVSTGEQEESHDRAAAPRRRTRTSMASSH